jgi:hypothetical protein
MGLVPSLERDIEMMPRVTEKEPEPYRQRHGAEDAVDTDAREWLSR